MTAAAVDQFFGTIKLVLSRISFTFVHAKTNIICFDPQMQVVQLCLVTTDSLILFFKCKLFRVFLISTSRHINIFLGRKRAPSPNSLPSLRGETKKATLSLQFRFAIHLRGKTKIIEHIRRSKEQDILHVFFYSLEPLSLFRLADVDDEPPCDVSSLPEPFFDSGWGHQIGIGGQIKATCVRKVT